MSSSEATPSQCTNFRRADGLCGFNCPATRKHSQPHEQRFQLRIEEIVAPANRRIEGAVAWLHVVHAVRHQQQSPAEPFQQR